MAKERIQRLIGVLIRVKSAGITAGWSQILTQKLRRKIIYMKVVEIQFTPWDKIYYFDPVNYLLSIDDRVIVKTEAGVELGTVVGFKDLADKTEMKGENSFGELEIKPILREATVEDLKKIPDKKQKQEDLRFCKKMIEKHGLIMKLVDAAYSFDGSKITFSFIADGRVDFRDLVKDLTRHFNRTIRLQQIGIRDEAKICGDFGHCGRPLCCGQFLGELSSITSEMAELQQCVHRGSERISGICGRLMCCLAYEEAGYKKMAEKMPALDSEVKIEGKVGRVIARHILKQTVEVQIVGANGEESTVVEVGVEKLRK